jgi:hypothetical protein
MTHVRRDSPHDGQRLPILRSGRGCGQTGENSARTSTPRPVDCAVLEVVADQLQPQSTSRHHYLAADDSDPVELVLDQNDGLRGVID